MSFIFPFLVLTILRAEAEAIVYIEQYALLSQSFWLPVWID